jgi:hypothetical protein
VSRSAVGAVQHDATTFGAAGVAQQGSDHSSSPFADYRNRD